jgi:hypothetical protein
MVRFDFIEAKKETHREQFLTAKPFPHIVLNGLCDEVKLTELYYNILEIETSFADYIFTKNKF